MKKSDKKPSSGAKTHKASAKAHFSKPTKNTPAPTRSKDAVPVASGIGFLKSLKQDDFIYGTHAVEAALANPHRREKILCIPENKYAEYASYQKQDSTLKIIKIAAHEFNHLLPAGVVHQSIALHSAPLDVLDEQDIDNLTGLVMILDSITDPHNIGAILRSCAAFGCKTLIIQDVHCPPLAGVIAKTAVGALDIVSIMKVSNLARAVQKLKSAGYFAYGADAAGSLTIPTAQLPAKTALIMGAEGTGIRRLVKEQCDSIISIPMNPQMESLNVSVASGLLLGHYYFQHGGE